MAAVVTKPSFIRFIYPFRFDGSLSDLKPMIEEGYWPGRDGTSEIRVWEQLDIPTDLMLAHMAEFFNPPECSSTCSENPASPRPPAILFWKLKDDALKKREGLWKDLPWELVEGGSPPKITPFEFEGAELALFPTGIGLLVINAHPAWDTDVDGWLQFLYGFRFASSQRGISIRARRRQGPEPPAPYLPPPVAAIKPLNQDGSGGSLRSVIEALLRPGPPSALPAKWWANVFVSWQMLPFAALYVDGLDPARDAHLLYRVRNFFHPGQGTAPALDDLQLTANPALLPYADRQWFTFSLDGGAFVACDAPGYNEPGGQFVRGTLAEHLRREYLLDLLLALHQRFTLADLSAQVARNWPDAELGDNDDDKYDEKREQALRQTREGLLDFTARGYFTQVMQSEHHHRVYRRWQDAFDIAHLYQEVSNEVREMHAYIEAQRAKEAAQREKEAAEIERLAEKRAAKRTREAEELAKRFERRVALFGLAFIGPSIALAILALPDHYTAALWALGGLFVGVIFLWTAIRIWDAIARWISHPFG